MYVSVKTFSVRATGYFSSMISLANGNAAKGIMELVKQAGAELVGMGFIIEKAFQHGGDELREQGIHVESLAIIESLDNCEIKIR